MKSGDLHPDQALSVDWSRLLEVEFHSLQNVDAAPLRHYPWLMSMPVTGSPAGSYDEPDHPLRERLRRLREPERRRDADAVGEEALARPERQRDGGRGSAGRRNRP